MSLLEKLTVDAVAVRLSFVVSAALSSLRQPCLTCQCYCEIFIRREWMTWHWHGQCYCNWLTGCSAMLMSDIWSDRRQFDHPDVTCSPPATGHPPPTDVCACASLVITSRGGHWRHLAPTVIVTLTPPTFLPLYCSVVTVLFFHLSVFCHLICFVYTKK